MSPIRFRDEEPSLGGTLASLAVGAIAGFTVGVIVAQKVGGISGITTRLRQRLSELEDDGDDLHREHHDEYGEDELEDEYEIGTAATLLEEQVLEAFQSDAVLSERAIDIGAVGDGVIELSGWVNDEGESRRAESVAQRVDGVEAVVNRLSVDDDLTRQEADHADRERRVIDTSEPVAGGQWEGMRVGTGRRRQGRSDEPDRHADPKPELEERWLDQEQAIREAAGDIEGIGERRPRSAKAPKGDRASGGPVAPGGVPKGDHVADPETGRDVDQNI